MKIISLFSGAGGLDYGFEAAGFETRVCVDFDTDACTTLSDSRRAWPIIKEDIHKISAEDILAAAGLADGETDVLVGGPPCQPYSKSGFWWGGKALRLDDPRAGTLGRYLEIVRRTRPKALLFENVDAFGYAGKDEGLEHLLDGLRAINLSEGTKYNPTYKVLDAAHFGVPQHRRRFFLVASREGNPFKFPDATHGEHAPTSKPYITAWDAIGDLDSLPNDPNLVVTGKWAGLLPSIPEGQNYLYHTPRGGGLPLFGWRTRYWNFLLKLAKDQPSWTIQAQPGPATGPFHWKNRHLSARELCRLQTFPDDVLVSGDRRAAQKQLGNAVPSLLAEVLARAIRVQLLAGKNAADQPKLLLECQSTIIKAESPAPVAEPYRRMIGKHSEHPGPGKGPRAVLRVAAE